MKGSLRGVYQSMFSAVNKSKSDCFSKDMLIVESRKKYLCRNRVLGVLTLLLKIFMLIVLLRQCFIKWSHTIDTIQIGGKLFQSADQLRLTFAK